jgi:PKD repeat protein
MADRRIDLGSTQPYQLQQFQRPLTLILDSLTESAEDIDGNGKFDVLKVVLLADVLQTGAYTWSGSVKAPDGTTLATAGSSGILNSVGIYNLALSFEGAAIGAAGINGPYTISNFGIYGPPNAEALKLKVGQTAGYTASQFEGFVAPTANTGGPYVAIDGQSIVFDGSASSDPDADPLTYVWDFGDGSSASGVSPSHTYALAGMYTVTLIVNDGQLSSSPASTTVTVTPSNFAPTANPGGPYTGIDGQTIVFDGSASTDPDADPLTYAWTFGDDSSASGVSPSHVYALPGMYSVTLVVNDGLLDSLSTSTTVTVVLPNVAPIANAGGPYNGIVGTPIVFDGSISSDMNGDVLSFSWDFGDGSTGSGVSPSHIYTAEGIYTVTLIVNDSVFTSEQAISTSSVGPGNNVPVADPNGPYFGFINTPITFNGSMSNDLDGDLLVYTWDFGDGNTGTGINPNHTYSATGFYTVSLVVNDGISNSLSVSTSVSVNNIQIDNDVPYSDVGSWRVEVRAGGESRDGWLTAVGTPSGTQFNQAEIVYDYFTYVDIGAPGGAVQLSSTVTSGPEVITSGVGVDRVRSSGTFTGENGNSIDWSVDSTIEDGSNTMENAYTFTAQSGAIGRIRLWQYLDEDVLGAGNDVFFVRGSSAELDLEMFTVDYSQSIGLSHSGSLAPGQGLVNSTFAGYAACRYNQMKSAIVSGIQGISPNGELCSTLLRYSLDHPVVGAAFGPIDVVSSLAWDVDPTAITATVVTTLGGVATAPVSDNQPPVCSAATPSVGTLWPPDHSLVPISINGVTDPEEDTVVIIIVSVTQDEPLNYVADGDTEPDAINQTVDVLIRSERAGNRNGRVYQIHFTADDGNGGSCTGNVQVEVPNSSNGNPVIDNGQIYNSL